VVVPWHSKGEAGVEWIDKSGSRARFGAWRAPKVAKTCLHATQAGLGLQTDDQTLWWLGEENAPKWNVKAKPYIYRVQHGPGTDVFIGTDGNGGRLLGFSELSGEETLNFRPVSGGVGDLCRVPANDVLVASVRKSRSYSIAPRLLVLSMSDRSYNLEKECYVILGTWEHGVVCRVGSRGERLAIVDIRSAGDSVDQ
jgi:hypothetical protein